MGGCSVHGCSNQSKDGFRLYRFPSGPYRRQQWVDKIVANLKQIQGSNRERGTWEPTHNHRICEVHFEKTCFMVLPNGLLKRKDDAVPTIFKTELKDKLSNKQLKLVFSRKLHVPDLTEASEIPDCTRPPETPESLKDATLESPESSELPDSSGLPEGILLPECSGLPETTSAPDCPGFKKSSNASDSLLICTTEMSDEVNGIRLMRNRAREYGSGELKFEAAEVEVSVSDPLEIPDNSNCDSSNQELWKYERPIDVERRKYHKNAKSFIEEAEVQMNNLKQEQMKQELDEGNDQTFHDTNQLKDTLSTKCSSDSNTEINLLKQEIAEKAKEAESWKKKYLSLLQEKNFSEQKLKVQLTAQINKNEELANKMEKILENPVSSYKNGLGNNNGRLMEKECLENSSGYYRPHDPDVGIKLSYPWE